MDKYLIKAPSWKTLSYQPVVASKGRSSLSGSLKNSNLQNVKKENRRLSVFDEKILQIISMPADEPLTPNGEKHCKDYFENGSPHTPINSGRYQDENQKPTNFSYRTPQQYRTPQSKASDYLSNTESSKISISEASNHGNVGFEKLLYGNDVQLKSPLKLQRININDDKGTYDRIQSDLNSPSASVRVRAMKALKDSNSYANYLKLDIPLTEQSIITPDDRKTPPPPPTIQDIMKNVIAYVEVRYGEDNRTAGIKKKLEALGAQVNNTLLRNTTHVIFNEGLLSTYKKAKNWNIPIVSILWVNDCETQIRLCDPKDYTISNADRYENPELYEKLKRVKCIHPDSELNKRVRSKPATPKDATPKTSTLTATATAGATGTPKTKRATAKPKSNSTKGKQKTDISQYFKSLSQKTNEPTPSTPLDEKAASNLKRKAVNSEQTPISSLNKQMHKVSLNCDNTPKVSVPKVPSNKGVVEGLEKINLHEVDDLDQIRIGAGHENTPIVAEIPSQKTPSPNKGGYLTRRRSSLLASASKKAIPSPKSTKKQKPSECISVIMEEANPQIDLEETNKMVESMNMESPSKKLDKGRRTSLNSHDLDISKSPEKKSLTAVNKNRRRTLFTPQKMELTFQEVEPLAKVKPVESVRCSIADNSWKNLVSSTLVNNELTPNSSVTLLEEHAQTLHFSSTREPKVRKSVFDVGMDIISQRMQNINRSARRSVYTNCAEELVAPACSKTNIEVFKSNTSPDLIAATKDKLNGQSSTNPINGIRKRKLFVPNDSLTQDLTPPIKIPNDETKSVQKRRRTLFPPINKPEDNDGKKESGVLHEAPIKNDKKNPKSLQNRRKTLTSSLTSAKNSEETEEKKSPPPLKETKTTSSRRKTLAPQPSKAEAVVEDDEAPAKVEKKAPKSSQNRRKTLMPPSSQADDIKPETNEPETFQKLKETPMPQAENTNENKTENEKKEEEEDSPTLVNEPDNENLNEEDIKQPAEDVNEALEEEEGEAASSLKTLSSSSQRRRSSNRVSMLFEKNDKSLKSQRCATKAITKDRRRVLVYTNMHVEQINTIREALTVMGGFRLDYAVNNSTTHLISYEPRRTLNMLRALIRGLWILDYRWIIDSRRAGKWLAEEPYEMNSFSRAVMICRTEKQAFKEYYQCDLFRDVDPFYVSTECEPLSKINLKELIKSCGGSVHEHRSTAKYIIASKHKGGGNNESIYVTPFWILDSITQMQLLPYQKYALPRLSTKRKPYTIESNFKSHAASCLHHM